MTKGEQNLLLLESLIASNEKFYVWCYDPDGGFIATSCPAAERDVLDRAFRILGGADKLVAYASDSGNTRPQIIGSSIGMQWALSYESDRNRKLIFVIGPVFYAEPLERHLRVGLRSYTHSRENAAWATELIRLLPQLPVMSYAIFTRYVMMVHNTLTGQQLGLDALVSGETENTAQLSESALQRDRDRVYLSERAMLQMVRNGDINYYGVLQGSIRLSPGVPIRGQDPLRQMKTSIVVFTTLVSRAAMEGGLSPEVAYALGDSYIQSAEDCRDSGELNLTEKFKKETGQSVSSYIRYAKVERAKVLLESTDLSIRDISERLAFNTVNYFIQCFRDTTGYTPAQYRRRFRKE